MAHWGCGQYHKHIIYIAKYKCTLIYILCTTVPIVTAPTGIQPDVLCSTSFSVTWTITNPDYNYIVIWIDLHTNMMDCATVPENTNSYTIEGLSSPEYNVTVGANNPCGIKWSDPMTVDCKNEYIQYTNGKIIVY